MLANMLTGMWRPIHSNPGAGSGGAYYPGAAIPETPTVNNNPVIDYSGGSSSSSTAPTSQGPGISATGHGDTFGTIGTVGGLLAGVPFGGMAGNAIGTGIDRGNIGDINSQYGLDPLQSNFATDMIGNTTLGQAFGVPNSSQAEMAQQNNAGVFGMEDPSMSVEGRTGLPGGVNFSTLAQALNAPAPASTSVNNNQIGLNGTQIGQSGPMGTIGESIFGDLGDPGTNQGLSIGSNGQMTSADMGITSFDDSMGVGGNGDGGSNSGTFICTELRRQGLITEQVYTADCLYGAQSDAPLVYGYGLWAPKVVRRMQASPKWTVFVMWFAIPWAEQMAFEMGVSKTGSRFGKFLMAVGYPLVRILGKIHG